MNGFEHQVAGHMIWEGMVQEGLAVERMFTTAITPRGATRGTKSSAATTTPGRWPATASFWRRAVTSITARRAIWRSPRGYAGEFPRRLHDRRRLGTLPSTAPRHNHAGNRRTTVGTIRRLRTLALQPLPGIDAGQVAASLNGTPLAVAHDVEQGTATLRFKSEVLINAGQTLNVVG